MGRLEYCHVLLHKNALVPWFILVPEVRVTDLLEVPDTQRSRIMAECAAIAGFIKKHFRSTKINFASLGNVVPQLHVHIIARRSNDVAWPRPVWGVMPPLEHDAEEVQHFISALRRKIWLG